MAFVEFFATMYVLFMEFIVTTRVCGILCDNVLFMEFIVTKRVREILCDNVCLVYGLHCDKACLWNSL